MTDDCKKCEQVYDVRWDGESTGYCDLCAQDRVAELEAQQPLVQEVIRLSKARDAVSPYAHKMRAHHASLLQVAARKLAEWKP